MKHLNVIGPQVRRLRDRLGWSQMALAVELHLRGWHVSRTTIAKIESRLRSVADLQMLYLADTLKVPVGDLFPKIDLQKRTYQEVMNLKF